MSIRPDDPIKIYECAHGILVTERCYICRPVAFAAEDLEAMLKNTSSPPECETVELMDEERDGPDDFVVFKDKSGFPVMWMPLRVYEWFRDHPEYSK